jgi:hypothetical protein
MYGVRNTEWKSDACFHDSEDSGWIMTCYLVVSAPERFGGIRCLRLKATTNHKTTIRILKMLRISIDLNKTKTYIL